MSDDPLIPQVLLPYSAAEAITIAEAKVLAGRSNRTLREWCQRYDIGRRIAGQWRISRVALEMLLSSDWDALATYLRGDRRSARVTTYFERCEVPLPRPFHYIREQRLSEVNEGNRP